MALILICGDRNWGNSQAIRRELGKLDPTDDVVIHGAARGADSIAGTDAAAMGFAVRSYPADWRRHGRAAGPIRNREMLQQRPDQVWAFHDDIHNSRGTADMLRIAKAAGIPTTLFTE
jgi:hypothetical protein